MAELAVTDGMPPPADLPRGEVITWPTGTGGQFTIGRADPRILISAELLGRIFVTPPPGVTLSLPPDWRHRYPPVHAPAFWEGGLLKVSGVNRTVIYRIGEYVRRINGYIAEWPD